MQDCEKILFTGSSENATLRNNSTCPYRKITRKSEPYIIICKSSVTKYFKKYTIDNRKCKIARKFLLVHKVGRFLEKQISHIKALKLQYFSFLFYFIFGGLFYLWKLQLQAISRDIMLYLNFIILALCFCAGYPNTITKYAGK